MWVAPKPPSLRAPFKRVPGFPGKVCISLPTFPCPAPNMARRWPARRAMRQKRLVTPPKFPFPPIPGFGGWWPGTRSQIRAPSLRCLVTLEAESDRWGRGRDTRSAARRRGTPSSAFLMNWKCYFLVKFSELALPAEGVSSVGRALSPAPSALKPACELIFGNDHYLWVMIIIGGCWSLLVGFYHYLSAHLLSLVINISWWQPYYNYKD